VPQLLGSEAVFVQTPPHMTCPAWQEPAPHVLFVHGVPLGQAVPQEPQFETSEVRVVQMPPQAVPRQESVSVLDCILYSTSKFASAPTLEEQVDPVRSEA
jgi:hypothetical protein